MNAQLLLLPGYLAAHLALTLVALLLGVLISVPLGILVTRQRALEGLVLGIAGIIQTIPGLALLAFMIPALAMIGAPAIGPLPALIGLTLYSILPVLRNTVTGISGVDPAVLEAADGVGMTPMQRLWRVELPLALPVMVAGIRTAAVWTVGTATLATPVGATSLGDYIFSGLQTRNYAALLLGCIASAGLALALDGMVRLLALGVERRNRSALAAGMAGFGLMALFASTPLWKHSEVDPVSIGAMPFTEQYILSQILAGRINRETHLPTHVMSSLGSTVLFDAMKAGQLDVGVDYTGTLATEVGILDPGTDRVALLQQLKQKLAEQAHIHLVTSLGFENTYALAMRQADVDAMRLTTVSSLAPYASKLRVGGDYEIFQRPEWQSIKQKYGMEFAEQRTMDSSLLYEAARTSQVDVITAYSTDGRITADHLAVLEDDRHAIPPYDAVILVSQRLMEERPEVVDVIRGLEGRIDAEQMRQMNAAVDSQGKTPEVVANEWLHSGG